VSEYIAINSLRTAHRKGGAVWKIGVPNSPRKSWALRNVSLRKTRPASRGESGTGGQPARSCPKPKKPPRPGGRAGQGVAKPQPAATSGTARTNPEKPAEPACGTQGNQTSRGSAARPSLLGVVAGQGGFVVRWGILKENQAVAPSDGRASVIIPVLKPLATRPGARWPTPRAAKVLGRWCATGSRAVDVVGDLLPK
jgi:hypothetical protein